LDLSEEEMLNDPRAVFQIETTSEQAQEKYNAFVKKLPTAKQIRYAFDNLLRNADINSISRTPQPIDKEKFEKWCEDNILDPYCVKDKSTITKFPDVETYMREYEGQRKDEKGNWGWYRNPRCTWDWYLVGGRWAGFFRVKEGAVGVQGHHRAKDFANITGEVVEDLAKNSADIVKVGDIDFEAMEQANKEKRKKWWKEAFEKYPNDAKTRNLIFSIQEDDILEEYIARENKFSTFAVLKQDENGEWQWYERGKMGFWGIVSDEKEDDKWDEEFEKLINGLYQDTVLTLVDCHI